MPLGGLWTEVELGAHRGKQDDGLKATTATKVKTVDTKKVPHKKDAQQTGRQATMKEERKDETVHKVAAHTSK